MPSQWATYGRGFLVAKALLAPASGVPSSALWHFVTDSFVHIRREDETEVQEAQAEEAPQEEARGLHLETNSVPAEKVTMARRKKETDMSDQNVAEPVMAIPVETPVEGPIIEAIETPVTTARFTPPVNGTNGRKPEVTYRCSVDKGTSIECSVWANQMQNGSGETWTQYSITIKRSYKDQTGTWVNGGSYRAHDLPVLQFLLTKAHAYCLNMRTDDSSIPF